MTKTACIKTYGCQMNELDSEVMAKKLENMGFELIDDETSAELVIFNTCAVRDLAERKVFGKLGILIKRNNRAKIIGITGCMASSKGRAIFDKFPQVNFILGPNDVDKLEQALEKVSQGSDHAAYLSEKYQSDIDYCEAKRSSSVKAYIPIAAGCNNFCSYCIVPYTRGRETSREPQNILQECKELANRGFKEITLLGQNVNSYGKDRRDFNTSFADLLYAVDGIAGIERVRFLTSNPIDISRELMEAVRDLSSVCEFVHFPIQSGSERILKKMNRKYTVKEYMEKISTFKAIVPEIKFGTDIIVGFPTEREEDFLDTFEIMKSIDYSKAFIYAYSPRKGTVSAKWEDDVSEDDKQERLQQLLTLYKELRNRQLQKLIGSEVEVLLEQENHRDCSLMKGLSRDGEKVLTKTQKKTPGSLQKVKILEFSNDTLIGTSC